jgi:hypothetical protein
MESGASDFIGENSHAAGSGGVSKNCPFLSILGQRKGFLPPFMLAGRNRASDNRFMEIVHDSAKTPSWWRTVIRRDVKVLVP